MALDKQVSIYSVDTSHFYSNRERKIHNKNTRLRYERKQIKDEIKRIDKKLLDDSFLYHCDTQYHLPGEQIVSHGNTLPLIRDEDTEILFRLRYLQNINKDKRAKIYETKEKLLEFFNRKVKLNEATHGRHHQREIKDTLNVDNVINIFDSSVTRLQSLESYDLSDNLIVVQVYFFEVFKDIFYYGFKYQGEDYQFFTSSAGQIRTKKAVFVKSSFYKQHEKTLLCGLTLDKINEQGGNNPNKHMAYTALSNSATDEWTDFDIDRTIVVDDFETLVYGTYDFVDDLDYSVKRMTDYVPIPHTDGAGMILPELSKTNFMVRMPWVKGLLGAFDFRKFINTYNCSPVIKDIYGVEHNIIDEDIQIILTKSQFKMH